MKLFRLNFDINTLAQSLMVPTEIAIKEFRDGRVISRFSEHWCAKLYKFEKNDSADEKGYDGIVRVGEFDTKYVAIRSLTKQGIKFQLSIHQGGGRKCTQEDLINSLKNIDYELVVDCREFPIVRFLPVDAKILLNLAKEPKAGRKKPSFTLNPSGLTPDGFYQHCFEKPVDKLIFIDCATSDLLNLK